MLRLALQELLVARARQRPERVSALRRFAAIQLQVLECWRWQRFGRIPVAIA